MRKLLHFQILFFCFLSLAAYAQPPVANFTSNITTGCEGMTVNYTDASSLAPTSWSWSFPGGTPASSTAQNPIVTYNTGGSYDVQLIASNVYGSDTMYNSSYIIVNANPVANAGADQYICSGQSLLLNGSTGGGYTYYWSPGAGLSCTSCSNPTFTGSTSASLTYSVTDPNGCVASDAVTITVNTNPSVTTTSTNVSCNGGSDGTATANSTGASPFTYNWSPETTQTITNKSAGTYNVTVTDANGCQVSGNAVIAQPTALIASISSSTNVSCNGGSDASATAGAAGGTGTYTYSWSPSGGLASSATGLQASNYFCYITDGNGCQTSTSINITQPAPLTVTTFSADESCFQGNGSTNSSVSGGTPGYTYTWNTSPAQTTAFATGLSSGTYSITVTDSNGCVANNFAVVGNAPGPTVIIDSIIPVSCFGGSDGSATANASGSGPFTYLWTPVGGTSATASGLPAGTYTCQVTDMNGCVESSNEIIMQPTLLTATTSNIINVSCFGGADGAVDITASGGTGPYSYSWSPSAGTSPNIAGLSAGPYTCYVSDANNCQTNVTATVSEPAAITISFIPTNALCPDLCNGFVNATVSGGNAPYTYLWSNTSTNEDLSSACPGTHTLQVTDATGCTINSNVAVGAGIPPAATITGPSGGCISDVLYFNGNPSSGSGNYVSHSWTGNQSPSVITGSSTASESFSSVSAGTYQLIYTVTDDQGCTGNDTTMITVFSIPVVIASSTNPVLCFGDSTKLNASGAISYSWSHGISDGVEFYPPASDTYIVTGTDANGCFSSDSIFITVNAKPSVTITPSPAIICESINMNMNGNPTGGSGGYVAHSWVGPGDVFLSNSSIENPLFNSSTNGSYPITYTVTDNNGCSGSANITVIVNGNPIAVITQDLASVCAGVNLNLSGNPTGGSGTMVSHSWSGTGASSLSTTTSFNTIFNNSTSGNYSLSYTVTDDNGCQGADSISFFVEPGVAGSISSTNVSCNGGSDGTATANLSTGTPPFMYLWNDGSSQTTATAANLIAGAYSVTVTDNNGCMGAINGALAEPADITYSVTSTDASCGASNGDIAISSVTGGTAPYTYLWSNGATSNTVSGLPSGNYSYTITDANGCQKTGNQAINNINGPTLTVSSTDPTCFGYSDGTASVTASAGIPPYTYSWDNGNSTPNNANLTAGIQSVYVTDSNGCVTVNSAELIDPTMVGVSLSTTMVSCNGDSSGSASAAGFGGFGPYSYSWNFTPVVTDSIIVAIPAGSYIVTVSDLNGCSASDTVLIGQPDAFVISSTTTDANCGQSSGSASVSVSFGTPPYNYFWNDPLTQTASAASNLAAGPYQVLITDANGCQDSLTVNINDIVGPTAIISTSSNVTCFGGNNGNAMVDATNGVAPYTYSWNDPLGQTSPFASGLIAGNYIVTIGDSAGCITSASVNITEPSPINISLNTIDASCNQSNGNISSIVSGGTGAYNYSWSNGSSLDNLSGVPAGNYSLIITDANGCVDSSSSSIFDQGSPQALLSCNMVSCFGGNDGSCASTVTNGTPPYSYNWSNGETTAAAGNLPAGNYVLVVSDQSGCADTVSSVISEPTLLEASASVNAANCGLANGNAMAVPSGGTPPYNYSWSNGGTDPSDSVLVAGNYILNVMDVNGCTASFNFIINNLDGPTITSVIPTPSTCPSVCDGSANAVVSGGTSPYTYQWNNNSTGANATNLCSGNYSVSVTDQTGCVFTSQVVVSATGIDPAITGNVTISGGPVTKGIVEVIAQADNSAVLEVVATGNIDSLGNYFIQDIPAGNYRIAAKADSMLFPNAVKTYLNMHYRWDLTTAVSSNCNAVDSFDLELINKPTMNGNGSISGVVSAGGSGKTNAPGDPIPGVDITLEQNPGGIISTTVTDAAGQYTFENVPAGNNYSIFVDIPGLGMAATYDIDITGNDTVVENNFYVDSTGTIDTFLNVTGIKHRVVRSNKTGISIAPNPFKNSTFITMTLGKTSEISLDIYDIRGVLVESVKSGKTEKGTYTFRFDDTKAPNGIYFVKMKAREEVKVVKMVKTR